MDGAGEIWCAAAGLDAALLDRLRAAYTEPGRHYHTWVHVLELCGHLAEVDRAGLLDHPSELRAAALFHDAVYDVRRSDNEARSAELARAELAGAGLDLDLVADLIGKTAAHGTEAAEVGETALFLDADMAILGAPWPRFAQYEREVQREYAPVVAAEAFAAGRSRFLERVQALPAIYRSPWFHERYEASARANIARALQRG